MAEPDVVDFDAELFPDLAPRCLLGRFERPNAAARQDEKVAASVAVTDQHQLALLVEEHHLHAARLGAKLSPGEPLERVEALEEPPHSAGA